ncbi:MAG: hypothetical protein Q4E75_04575 [bacterium]|nr:hypothetical protein [bacterium]
MVKIRVEDYEEFGLGDIYYGLLSFISKYVNQNFDPLEVLMLDDNQQSKYAIAINVMKESLKEILDYLKNNSEVYLPKLNKSVNINSINVEEQLAVEERCKEYMILKLNKYFTGLNLQVDSHNKKM